MIDEAYVNHESGLYTTILREIPSLIVLAVGFRFFFSYTLSFPERGKYNPCEILLQEEELDDVAIYLLDEVHRRNITCSIETLSTFCHWLHLFVGGQLHPFLSIFDHVFSMEVHSKHFDRYQCYLTGRYFYDTVTMANIFNRCYDNNAKVLVYQVLNGDKYDPLIIEQLEKLGYWDKTLTTYCDDYGWFASNLLLCIASNGKVQPMSNELNEQLKSVNAYEKIESIIIIGIREMSKSHFHESRDPHATSIENGIGFFWGSMVRNAFPSLFIAPQTSTRNGMKRGWLDYVFNSGMDVAIELARNNLGVNEKIDKFSSGKIYGEWKDRWAILNFNVKKTKINLLSSDERVYHFDVDENILYKGKKNSLCESFVELTISSYFLTIS
jgi:hypothetical protein